MREWRASRSSMWSRKPIPVDTDDVPAPSRSTATSISVSLVVRFTEPLRMLQSQSALAAGLLSGAGQLRYCSMEGALGTLVPSGALLRAARGFQRRPGDQQPIGHAQHQAID